MQKPKPAVPSAPGVIVEQKVITETVTTVSTPGQGSKSKKKENEKVMM